MANKTTKFLTQSIGGVLLLGVVSTFLADWLKSVSFLTTLRTVLVWLWNGLIWLLNFEVKIWWLLVGIIIVIILVALLSHNSNKSEPEPSFLKYRKDSFEKWVWKWEWRFNGSRFQINNLRPCCPVCETPLIEERSSWHGNYILECPRGHGLNKRGMPEHTEDIHKIEILILDNIDKGNFKETESQ